MFSEYILYTLSINLNWQVVKRLILYVIQGMHVNQMQSIDIRIYYIVLKTLKLFKTFLILII